MARHREADAEFSVSDGTRHIGRVAPRNDAYEARSANGDDLGMHPSREAARRAVIDADRQHRIELDRLADGAGCLSA